MEFADKEITASLASRAEDAAIMLKVDELVDLKPEGFMIRKNGDANHGPPLRRGWCHVRRVGSG
jgi:hypothetical protein